jgi:hypothetical protein
MEEKLDKLIAEVEKLREEAKPEEKSLGSKILHVVEKLIIPIMLGVLGWVGTQAGTKISEGQLRLSESAAEDRKVEFRRNMQAKYIEIFYKDLNSGDSKSQMNAIRLVRLVDSELAQNLLDLVPGTPGVSQAVVAKAGEVKQQLAAVAPLSGYKIGIYFYDNDPSSIPSVLKVAERLKDAGFSGTVQQYPSNDAFFENVNRPSGLEVRYEAGIEDQAADALLAIVQTADNRNRWIKRQVGSRTPNFISVFVPRGG